MDVESLADDDPPSGERFFEDRRANDHRLKRRFEDIFSKYERDFDGIGDEIDLLTGAIIVDNGHIRSMQAEDDTGHGEFDSDEEDAAGAAFVDSFAHEYDSAAQTPELIEDGEDDVVFSKSLNHIRDQIRSLPNEDAYSSAGYMTEDELAPPQHVDGSHGSLSRRAIDNHHSQQNERYREEQDLQVVARMLATSGSAPSRYIDPDQAIDPLWQAPELPQRKRDRSLSPAPARPNLSSSAALFTKSPKTSSLWKPQRRSRKRHKQNGGGYSSESDLEHGRTARSRFMSVVNAHDSHRYGHTTPRHQMIPISYAANTARTRDPPTDIQDDYNELEEYAALPGTFITCAPHIPENIDWNLQLTWQRAEGNDGPRLLAPKPPKPAIQMIPKLAPYRDGAFEWSDLERYTGPVSATGHQLQLKHMTKLHEDRRYRDPGVPEPEKEPRRNYTPQEDELLLRLYQQGLTWRQIQSHFKDRDAGSLANRYTYIRANYAPDLLPPAKVRGQVPEDACFVEPPVRLSKVGAKVRRLFVKDSQGNSLMVPHDGDSEPTTPIEDGNLEIPEFERPPTPVIKKRQVLEPHIFTEKDDRAIKRMRDQERMMFDEIATRYFGRSAEDIAARYHNIIAERFEIAVEKAEAKRAKKVVKEKPEKPRKPTKPVPRPYTDDDNLLEIGNPSGMPDEDDNLSDLDIDIGDDDDELMNFDANDITISLQQSDRPKSPSGSTHSEQAIAQEANDLDHPDDDDRYFDDYHNDYIPQSDSELPLNSDSGIASAHSTMHEVCLTTPYTCHNGLTTRESSALSSKHDSLMDTHVESAKLPEARTIQRNTDARLLPPTSDRSVAHRGNLYDQRKVPAHLSEPIACPSPRPETPPRERFLHLAKDIVKERPERVVLIERTSPRHSVGSTSDSDDLDYAPNPQDDVDAAYESEKDRAERHEAMMKQMAGQLPPKPISISSDSSSEWSACSEEDPDYEDSTSGSKNADVTVSASGQDVRPPSAGRNTSGLMALPLTQPLRSSFLAQIDNAETDMDDPLAFNGPSTMHSLTPVVDAQQSLEPLQKTVQIVGAVIPPTGEHPDYMERPPTSAAPRDTSQSSGEVKTARTGLVQTTMTVAACSSEASLLKTEGVEQPRSSDILDTVALKPSAPGASQTQIEERAASTSHPAQLTELKTSIHIHGDAAASTLQAPRDLVTKTIPGASESQSAEAEQGRTADYASQQTISPVDVSLSPTASHTLGASLIQSALPSVAATVAAPSQTQILAIDSIKSQSPVIAPVPTTSKPDTAQEARGPMRLSQPVQLQQSPACHGWRPTAVLPGPRDGLTTPAIRDAEVSDDELSVIDFGVKPRNSSRKSLPARMTQAGELDDDPLSEATIATTPQPHRRSSAPLGALRSSNIALDKSRLLGRLDNGRQSPAAAKRTASVPPSKQKHAVLVKGKTKSASQSSSRAGTPVGSSALRRSLGNAHSISKAGPSQPSRTVAKRSSLSQQVSNNLSEDELA